MKRFLFVPFVITSFFVSAQEQKWEWLNPSLNGNYMNALNLLPGGSTIIISYDSMLLVSEDRGMLWNSLPVSYRAYKVFAPSSALSFMTTMDGEIVKNVLGGTPKTVYQKSAVNSVFTDVQIDSVTGIGLALGGYEVHVPFNGGYSLYNWALILRTTDFGEHWTIVYEAEGDRLNGLFHHRRGYTAYGTQRWNYAVESPDGIVWAINADFGRQQQHEIVGLGFVNDSVGVLSYANVDTLFITHNGGISWQPGSTGRYFDRFTVSDSSLFGTWVNSMYVSHDMGNTWTHQIVMVPGLNVIDFVVQGNVIAARDQLSGVFVATGDDYTFKSLNNNIEYNVVPGGYFVGSTNQTFFTSANIGYLPLIGSGGQVTMYKTTDSGCHWPRLPYFPGSYLPRFYFFDDDNWAIVNQTVYYKTTDGGLTWTSTGYIGGGYGGGRLLFFSPSVGIEIDGDNDVYKTTNGGITWTKVSHVFGSYGAGRPFMLNATTAMVPFPMDAIGITTDAGDTWTNHTVGFNLNWYGTHFFDTQNGLLVGWNDDAAIPGAIKSYLVRTSNGGNNWTKVRDLPAAATGMKFFDPLNGFIWGKNGMVLRTTDGGTTWRTLKTIITTDIISVFMFGDQIYITGDNYSIIKTTVAPTAAFQLPDKTFCLGDTLVPLNQSENGTSFRWSVDGQVVTTDRQPEIIVNNTPGLHPIELTSGTCQFTYYAIARDTIMVNPSPDKPILFVNDKTSAGPVNVCDSTYTVTTQPFYEYEWSNGITTPSVVLNQESSLSLLVTNTYGCSSHSDTLRFIRVPLPVAAFDVQSGQHIGDVSFHSESTGADTYFWLLSDSVTSVLPDWSYAFAEIPREFTVTLVVGNFCGRDTLRKEINYLVLGIQDPLAAEQHIYPNPSRGSETIFVDGDNTSHYSIQSVAGTSVVGLRPLSGHSITLPSLPSGIYCVLVYDKGGMTVHRLVVIEER